MSGRRPAWKRVVDVRVGLVELERETEALPRSQRPEVEQVREELVESVSRSRSLADQLGELTREGTP